ncbi:DNA ligase [Thiomicrorhabdus aquaedulcis]|uniref:DNA ligase n=1 Tax=Thiomicrorhabdus aquaedulcis TaxID=2211106 RepID=UPI000FDAB4DB|nr:DNA ligase [Thiomicrorhabdus aquaedulcis]
MTLILSKHSKANPPGLVRLILKVITVCILAVPMPSLGAVERPNIMLLTEYSNTQEVNGWVMSEKLDGVRALWDGKQLISRNGLVFAVPEWFIAGFPPFALDGELWLARGQFEQTVSVVNQLTAHSGWQTLTYQVFEVPYQPGGLLARLAVVNDYLKTHSAPYLRVLAQAPILENSDVQRYLHTVLAQGGEGVVVRNPQHDYQVGRLASAQKVKLKQDAECVVQGVTAGKGKYTQQAGALLCALPTGQFAHLVGELRVLKIGSGLTDALRATPPPFGSCVTFQYMGLTQKGLPRFPVFLRVRNDGCGENSR